jgi:hypothetical protein
VYLDSIEKEVDLKVWWRPDNQQKWIQWDAGVEACALMEDANVSSVPHVWKNLLPQYRPQIKTFTIPDNITEITKRPMALGFEFQLRVSWAGKLRITRVLLHAINSTDQMQADTDLLPQGCIYNDVTGNSIDYTIPIRVRAGEILTTEDGVDLETEDGLLLGTG